MSSLEQDAPSARNPEGGKESHVVFYDVFGEGIELRSRNPKIAASLAQRESCWKPLVRTAIGVAPAAVVEVIQHPSASPLNAVQHFSNEHFFFHGSRSRLLTGYLYRRPWQIHVQSFAVDDETTIDNMILPTLSNVLLRLGMVNVHAAAVARSGEALLLVGPSGAGKSTTSLLLARAGFDFLSDNDVYLRRSGDRVEAFSSSNELFLQDSTADRLRDLDFVRDLPQRMRGTTTKRILAVDEAMPDRCVSRARAAALVFPSVGEHAATELIPLDAFTCLDRLLHLVPARGLPAAIKDRFAQTTQFETLATLVSSVSAFEVRLGSDPAGVVETLGALI